MGKYSGTTANKFLNLTNDRIGIYNAWDTYNTARLVAPLMHELKDNNQVEHYQRHIEPLQTAVVHMQSRGMLVDRKAKSRYRNKLRGELHEVDACIQEAYKNSFLEATLTSGTLNPNSDKQIASWLFKSRENGGLGLLVGKHTAGGAPSVDQEALTGILRKLRKKDQHAIPVIHALFHRSRLQTIEERYLDFDLHPDNRVRPRIKMAKAKTMRLAYQDPALQQFVPEIRHMFIPKPGHVFLSRDYSQLEAKLLAYMSMDQVSIDVFESGGDVHLANAIDTVSKRNYFKSRT